MKNKELCKRLYTLAILKAKENKIEETISEEFEDCSNYEVMDILYNCTVKDDCLYNNKGCKLANGGLIDDKYFCNQSVGYCEDDYYGYMYYPVDDKGTYVKVWYDC